MFSRVFLLVFVCYGSLFAGKEAAADSIAPGDWGVEYRLGAGEFSSAGIIGHGTRRFERPYTIGLRNFLSLDAYGGYVYKIFSLGVEYNFATRGFTVAKAYAKTYESVGYLGFLIGELAVRPFRKQIAGNLLEPYFSTALGITIIEVDDEEKYPALIIRGGMGLRVYACQKLKESFLYLGVSEMHVSNSSSYKGVLDAFNIASASAGIGINIR